MWHDLRHFGVKELVPPSVYNALGEKSIILMDWRILYTLDSAREIFNAPIIVNNWHTGGKFTQRGFRDDVNTGAKYSQHRYGRAVDFDVKGVSAEEVRKEIIRNQNNYFSHITVLESDVKWVHMDCRNSDKEGIVLIKP